MRLPAALLSGALLAAALTTPAHAADPAPTNVRIAWKDSTYQQVVVRWDEIGRLPNQVVVRKAGTDVVRRTLQVAADAENSIELPKELLRVYGATSGTLDIAVSTGTGSPLGRVS